MIDIFIILSLATLIAIPLAFLIHFVSGAWHIHKMYKPLREIVPNIIPADGFKLHEAGTKQKKPRPRKSNVTAIKRGPKEAA